MKPKIDQMPSPDDPPPKVCAYCRNNREGVCVYAGFGNTYYGPDYKGRKITWDPEREHCGQFGYAKNEWRQAK